MSIPLLLALSLAAGTEPCSPPSLSRDGRVVTPDGIAFSLPAAFARSAVGILPPRSGGAGTSPAQWQYTAAGQDGARVDVSTAPATAGTGDPRRPRASGSGAGCAPAAPGEAERVADGEGRGYRARTTITCGEAGVSVTAVAPSPAAARALAAQVTATVRRGSAPASGAVRREASAEAALAGCYRVAGEAGGRTQVRCLDAGGAVRWRREAAPTSRPPAPEAPPPRHAWKLGSWRVEDGNLLVCMSMELWSAVAYGPVTAGAGGFSFRDERWTRVSADVPPPPLVERPLVPGLRGQVDKELTLPAGLTWDDGPPEARRKLADLRFVAERRLSERRLQVTFAGTWAPGIASDRIELEFQDGRLDGVGVVWAGADLPTPTRTWEALVARLVSEHGAPGGRATVEEARARAQVPPGVEPHDALDAALRGDGDLRVSDADLMATWVFRRDAHLIVGVHGAPRGRRAASAGDEPAPTLVLSLRAPR